MSERLNFACDYNQGAHPAILRRMLENNLVKSGVYGDDAFSESARAKIREACAAPEADVWFLVGGTQTNAAVLDSVLRLFEGVLSANTGYICIHEAGAIERGGHKVLALPGKDGKISAADIRACWDTWYSDGNRTHVVRPGAFTSPSPLKSVPCILSPSWRPSAPSAVRKASASMWTELVWPTRSPAMKTT